MAASTMQPETVRAPDGGDPIERIERRRRRRAAGGDDRARHATGGEIGLDGQRQCFRLHRMALVGRNDVNVVATESCQQRRLLDRAVAVRRDVDDQRRDLGLQPATRQRKPGSSLAGTEQRHERRRGRRILDDSAPRRAETHHLPDPVGRDLLELRERRTRLPRQAEHAEPRAQVVAEHGREFAVRREVAEEIRMLPVRQARQDHRLEIPQHRVEALGRVRRRSGQLRTDRARRDPRHHRKVTDARPVIRDPVDDLVAQLAELVGRHAWFSDRRSSRRARIPCARRPSG